MAGGSSGGITPFTLVSAATNNATQISTGPSQLMSFSFGNVNAAARFVKFYDTGVASSTSAASYTPQTPVLNFIIPGNTAGAGSNIAMGGTQPQAGYQFVNGIGMMITANIALADNSAVGAGDVCVNIGWR